MNELPNYSFITCGMIAVLSFLLLSVAYYFLKYIYENCGTIVRNVFSFVYDVLLFCARCYVITFAVLNVIRYSTILTRNHVAQSNDNSLIMYNHQTINQNNMHMHSQATIDHSKKTLVLFKFDEIYTSSSSVEKFENINKAVNFVVDTFEHMSDDVEFGLILSSGGGSSLYFERAYSNLMRLKNYGFKSTAVIDSICTSGCYMIACASDEIIAGNNSIVGSIGVFTKAYNGANFSKMIGVEEMVFKTSNKKAGLVFLGENKQEELEHVQNGIDKTMNKFTEIVKKGRPNVSSELFDADTFYAEVALKHGLIDKIQMLEDFMKEKSLTHNILVIEEQKKNGFMSSGKVVKYLEKIFSKVSLLIGSDSF